MKWFRFIRWVVFALLVVVSAQGDAFDERESERNLLVDVAIRQRGVSDEAVLQAMRRVPRHVFVPEEATSYAYLDRALAIGYGQTISQPFIVAYMTEALELSDDAKVLEIGTGSAYQASVLAEITRNVFTIEIIAELANSAWDTLDSLGYEYVESKQADGYFGWEEAAPFDAIIVTAAADHVPPSLIAQLAPGGVMIIPVGTPQGVQTLIRIRKRSNGRVERDGLMYVRFVPFTREKKN